MSIERDPHPSREQLAAFNAGQLAAAERAVIERHLAACQLCGRELDSLPEDPFVALVRASAGSPSASTSETPGPALPGIPDALARRRRWPWLLAAVVLLAAGTIAFVIGRHRPTESQPEPPPPQSVNPLALATPEDVLRLREERREQAMDWIRKNNRWGADRGGVVAVTARSFAQYSGRIDGYLISFGSRLLRSQQNTLLAANLGGFFDFPLTTTQAQALGLKAEERRFLSYGNLNDPRRRTPRVRLSDLKIDQADRLDTGAKVSGSVAYEVIGPPIARPFAVRLSFYNARRRHAVLCWFKQSTLQGRGTLPFHFPVLTSANIQLRGPLVLFAEVCTDLDRVPLVESDAAAILVEAIPPTNPLQP